MKENLVLRRLVDGRIPSYILESWFMRTNSKKFDPSYLRMSNVISRWAFVIGVALILLSWVLIHNETLNLKILVLLISSMILLGMTFFVLSWLVRYHFDREERKSLRKFANAYFLMAGVYSHVRNSGLPRNLLVENNLRTLILKGIVWIRNHSKHDFAMITSVVEAEFVLKIVGFEPEDDDQSCLLDCIFCVAKGFGVRVM